MRQSCSQPSIFSVFLFDNHTNWTQTASEREHPRRPRGSVRPLPADTAGTKRRSQVTGHRATVNIKQPNPNHNLKLSFSLRRKCLSQLLFNRALTCTCGLCSVIFFLFCTCHCRQAPRETLFKEKGRDFISSHGNRSFRPQVILPRLLSPPRTISHEAKQARFKSNILVLK